MVVYYSIIQFINADYIFGTGLGTWGDFSSVFNNSSIELSYNIPDSKMADSYFAHLLMEQGILILLYYYLIYRVFTIYSPFAETWIYYISFLIMFLTTMGLSSSGIPFVFLYTIMLINYYKKTS